VNGYGQAISYREPRFSTTPRSGIPNQPAPNPGGESATAADPSGALSLPEAVSKQLGLKLELKKRPMQVLVIDHVNEKPTEN